MASHDEESTPHRFRCQYGRRDSIGSRTRRRRERQWLVRWRDVVSEADRGYWISAIKGRVIFLERTDQACLSPRVSDPGPIASSPSPGMQNSDP